MLEIHPNALAALVDGGHGAPFDILGPQPADKDQTSIRAFRPNAKTLMLLDNRTGERLPMTREHEAGLFERSVPGLWTGADYSFEAETTDGRTEAFSDPYGFPSALTDYDIYLFNEGKHYHIYDKMGAHLHEIDGVAGVLFAVWAPNAHSISVVGDFNGWDMRYHLMRRRGENGVWELFIPGVLEGSSYKYHIRSRFMGYHIDKTDPYGFAAEMRPSNASVVADIDTYTWGDDAWIKQRDSGPSPLYRPMSTYEVHLGSWRRKEDGSWYNYREIAHMLVDYVKMMGYTHIELMPILEHPFDGSWGYQVVGYYAPTSRYGSPTDFMYFVDHCHQNGIGIILDWVPAHFPKDGHGLSFFDGTQLYEHADPRQGEHPDWGTYIFNYGRNEVRNFLTANALFWLRRYHLDGLRVDAVSSMLYLDFSRKHDEWVPNKYGSNENLEAIEFIKEVNELVHSEFPGVAMVAEESTAWPMVSRPLYLGGLGFTLKWNMGWMHDTLQYIEKDPIHRRFHHHMITFSMLYAFNENFVLSLSHDEVVHGKGSLITKMAGDIWQKFAGLRLLFGYQYSMPGKKLNFMGQEIGQWDEWRAHEALQWGLLEWPLHAQVQAFMRDLNRIYASEPALYELDFSGEGFQWIEANDSENSVFAYIRYANDRSDYIVVVMNFTPVVRTGYRVGVPDAGFYRELLNSDSEHYGGGNIGNGGGVHAETVPWQNQPHRLTLSLPPLSIVLLKPSRPMR